MKYTFLMPAYKARFIRQAIDSILAQTYKDFILIVSDDCSPEDLRAIVQEYDDSRLVHRRNEQNIGGKDLVAHWNLLLGLAESDYVILAPDDDYYAPNFLEEIDKLATKHQNVDVLKCRAQMVDDKVEIFAKDMIYEEVISQLDNAYSQTLGNFVSGIGNYVFSTKALCDIGGFVQYPRSWWSDVMTHLKLSKNGMAVTRDILFSFRQSEVSISTGEYSTNSSIEKCIATNQFYQDAQKLFTTTIMESKYDLRRKKRWEDSIKNSYANQKFTYRCCFKLITKGIYWPYKLYFLLSELKSKLR